MEIKPLNNTSFEAIYTAFKASFEDYLVDVSYMNASSLQNRAIKNGYLPEVSAGVFDAGRLVGFALVGIDGNYPQPSAFDIMTGFEKNYRGQGLAGKLFHFIRSTLEIKRIEKFYLEVIRENEAALNAYRKAGFTVNRAFNCYILNVTAFREVIPLRLPVRFSLASRDVLSDFETFSDWTPSWENSFSAIRRIPDEVMVITASFNIRKLGAIIYYPGLNWIMNLLVDPAYRNMGIGSALITELIHRTGPHVGQIKFLNIPEDDYVLHDFLINSGFVLYARQYEMILDLTS